MKKNALTTFVGVLLVIYSLINFGAAIGQFGKAKAVSGTTSMAADIGHFAGDHAGADKLKREMAASNSFLYLVAILILITAVLDMVSAIGLFSGQNWASSLLIATAVCGIVVEIQDVAEDGFGIGKLIFFSINALALITAFSAKNPELPTA